MDKKSKILPDISTTKIGRSTVRVRNKTQVDGFPLVVSQSSSPDLLIDKALSKASDKKLSKQKKSKISALEIED